MVCHAAVFSQIIERTKIEGVYSFKKASSWYSLVHQQLLRCSYLGGSFVCEIMIEPVFITRNFWCYSIFYL